MTHLKIVEFHLAVSLQFCVFLSVIHAHFWQIFFVETLIVDTKPMSQEEKDAIERAKRLAEDEILARQLAETAVGANGILLKQVVDADNSCLFTSIGFLLSGKVDTTCGNFMRQIIAQTVHNEKETYNSGILGRDNAEYCAWIMQESNWGGAIEVAILSQHYGKYLIEKHICF